jgi:hypothetical protein
MASRSYRCRYCGESFVPKPGKPGFVDECPDCLHEKTRPKLPMDFASRFTDRYPDLRRPFKDLRKLLLSLGIDEAALDGAIADAMKQSGKEI